MAKASQFLSCRFLRHTGHDSHLQSPCLATVTQNFVVLPPLCPATCQYLSPYPCLSTQWYMCHDSFASSTLCLASKRPILLQQTMIAQLNETQSFPSHVGMGSRSFSLRQWLWVRPPHNRHAITRCYKEAKKQPPPRLPVPEEVCVNPELLLTAKLKSWLSSELLPWDTKNGVLLLQGRPPRHVFMIPIFLRNARSQLRDTQPIPWPFTSRCPDAAWNWRKCSRIDRGAGRIKSHRLDISNDELPNMRIVFSIMWMLKIK